MDRPVEYVRSLDSTAKYIINLGQSMSIALTTKVKELENRIHHLEQWLQEYVYKTATKLEELETVYNQGNTPESDPPKRRGRPAKHENE